MILELKNIVLNHYLFLCIPFILSIGATWIMFFIEIKFSVTSTECNQVSAGPGYNNFATRIALI